MAAGGAWAGKTDFDYHVHLAPIAMMSCLMIMKLTPITLPMLLQIVRYIRTIRESSDYTIGMEIRNGFADP